MTRQPNTVHTIDDLYRDRGTRFHLYAQSPWVEGFQHPVTVWLSPRPGQITAGPRDRRIRTRDADKRPFRQDEEPIYRGPLRPAVPPGPRGHFDHVEPEEPNFIPVHAFGCIRRTLDIWEFYNRRRIAWPMTGHRPLDLYPRVDWNNAQFGAGFIEAGSKRDENGVDRLFALNFDVLAHEAGHAIAFSLGGVPRGRTIPAEFVGFHEAMADMIAVLSSMHFSRVLWRALETCQGNLYAENAINRVGELSASGEIRLLNSRVVHDAAKCAGKSVDDVPSKVLHDISLPFSSAMMDILIYFYVLALARFGILNSYKGRLGALAGRDPDERASSMDVVRPRYAAEPELFQLALVEARDRLARLVVSLLRRVNADNLTLTRAGRALVLVARRPEYADARTEICATLRERGLLTKA